MEHNADASIVLQVYTNGVIYIQPGTTVGKMLAVTQALEDMVLNIQINTTPTEALPPADASVS